MSVLRKINMLRTGIFSITGKTADENLDWWEKPERSIRFLKLLHALCWVNPDGAIFPPGKARELDPTGTMSFSRGNASGISDFTIHSR